MNKKQKTKKIVGMFFIIGFLILICLILAFAINKKANAPKLSEYEVEVTRSVKPLLIESARLSSKESQKTLNEFEIYLANYKKDADKWGNPEVINQVNKLGKTYIQYKNYSKELADSGVFDKDLITANDKQDYDKIKVLDDLRKELNHSAGSLGISQQGIDAVSEAVMNQALVKPEPDESDKNLSTFSKFESNLKQPEAPQELRESYEKYKSATNDLIDSGVLERSELGKDMNASDLEKFKEQMTARYDFEDTAKKLGLEPETVKEITGTLEGEVAKRAPQLELSSKYALDKFIESEKEKGEFSPEKLASLEEAYKKYQESTKEISTSETNRNLITGDDFDPSEYIRLADDRDAKRQDFLDAAEGAGLPKEIKDSIVREEEIKLLGPSELSKVLASESEKAKAQFISDTESGKTADLAASETEKSVWDKAYEGVKEFFDSETPWDEKSPAKELTSGGAWEKLEQEQMQADSSSWQKFADEWGGGKTEGEPIEPSFDSAGAIAESLKDEPNWILWDEGYREEAQSLFDQSYSGVSEDKYSERTDTGWMGIADYSKISPEDQKIIDKIAISEHKLAGEKEYEKTTHQSQYGDLNDIKENVKLEDGRFVVDSQNVKPLALNELGVKYGIESGIHPLTGEKMTPQEIEQQKRHYDFLKSHNDDVRDWLAESKDKQNTLTQEISQYKKELEERGYSQEEIERIVQERREFSGLDDPSKIEGVGEGSREYASLIDGLKQEDQTVEENAAAMGEDAIDRYVKPLLPDETTTQYAEDHEVPGEALDPFKEEKLGGPQYAEGDSTSTSDAVSSSGEYPSWEDYFDASQQDFEPTGERLDSYGDRTEDFSDFWNDPDNQYSLDAWDEGWVTENGSVDSDPWADYNDLEPISEDYSSLPINPYEEGSDQDGNYPSWESEFDSSQMAVDGNGTPGAPFELSDDAMAELFEWDEGTKDPVLEENWREILNDEYGFPLGGEFIIELPQRSEIMEALKEEGEVNEEEYKEATSDSDKQTSLPEGTDTWNSENNQTGSVEKGEENVNKEETKENYLYSNPSSSE